MPNQTNDAIYIVGGFGNCDGKEENLTAKLEIKITNQHFTPYDVPMLLSSLGGMFAEGYIQLEKFLESACEHWELTENGWVEKDPAAAQGHGVGG